MTTDDDAVLLSYGWLAWPEAVSVLAGAGGVWLGPSGITTVDGVWPAALPLTTRIHAWAGGRQTMLWRLVPRTGAGTVLVTALAPKAAADAAVAGHGEVRRRGVAVESSIHEGWERHWVYANSAVMFLRPAPPDGRGCANRPGSL